MVTTSPDNIWTPDSGTTYALTTDLAATATSIQAALTAQKSYLIGTNAARLLVTTPVLRDGLKFYATDTDIEWFYNGTSWVAVPARTISVSTMLAGTTYTAGATLIEKSGVTGSIATNVNGDASIPFPAAFPNGVISVQLMRINYAALGATFEILASTQSLSQVNFRVYGSAGVALASVPNLQYHYRALGW